MFSAYAVIIAFVIGAVAGVLLMALAIRLGTPPAQFDPEATLPQQPQPKHRPITGSNFGPDAVNRLPAAPPASAAHRPISGG